mgnify:CR=1 FL=1
MADLALRDATNNSLGTYVITNSLDINSNSGGETTITINNGCIDAVQISANPTVGSPVTLTPILDNCPEPGRSRWKVTTPNMPEYEIYSSPYAYTFTPTSATQHSVLFGYESEQVVKGTPTYTQEGIGSFNFTVAGAPVAGTIAEWDFSSGYTTPSATATGISASSTSNNLAATTPSLGYATDPILRLAPPDGTTNANIAYSNDSYFAFTINPGGQTIDFDQITLDASKGGTSTPRGYALRFSTDGYATAHFTETLAASRPTFESPKFVGDLSGLAIMQNITSPVTIRLYPFSLNPSSSRSVEIDNVEIVGTIN